MWPLIQGSSLLKAIFSCVLNCSFLDNWKTLFFPKISHLIIILLILPLNNFTVRKGYIRPCSSVMAFLSWVMSWFVSQLIPWQPSILTQSSSVLKTSKIIALLGHAITYKLMRNSPQHSIFFGIPSQSLPWQENFPFCTKQGGTHKINHHVLFGDSGGYKRPFNALMKLCVRASCLAVSSRLNVIF